MVQNLVDIIVGGSEVPFAIAQDRAAILGGMRAYAFH